MLPVLTQAINRQIILALGTTREALHFNEPPNFYPLAHINDDEKFEELDCFDYHSVDYYKELVKKKLKRLAKKKVKFVPTYRIGQLVMKKNTKYESSNELYPSPPFTGPYQIVKVDFRNVELKDLKSGELVQAYIEHIKPVSLKEFRLYLNEGTLMPKVVTRRATRKFTPILDDILNPFSLEEVLTLDDCIESDDEDQENKDEPDESEVDNVPENQIPESMCTLLSQKANDSLEKLYEKKNSKTVEFVKNSIFRLFK